MHPIIAFPALAGMSYPRLEGRDLIRAVRCPEDIPVLPEAERKGVRVLMTSATRGCSRQVVDALPDLALVVSQGAGQDRIDLPALAARGVRLRSVGEALTDDVADLAMALTQMLCRDLVRANVFARDGSWAKDRYPLGTSLVGLTMGIGGLSGRIGQAIAARARASRMVIAGLDRRSNESLGAALHGGWEALAAASDVLVLALPGSPGGPVVGARELAALGSKGWLVNVARGSLLDTDALIDALEKGTIAGAALDVLEGEPNVPERLAALPNVVITPHIGAQTWGQRARGSKIADDEIMSFLGEA